MGTLSKTVASQGGFVTGKKDLIDYLRNTSRPFMYSSGLSPANTAAALAALKIIQKNKSLKKKLLSNAKYLKKNLQSLGFQVRGDYQILTVGMKSVKEVMQFQKSLEKEGIFVTGIRPPTVKTPRLRITVMATHTKKDLDKSVKAFQEILHNSS